MDARFCENQNISRVRFRIDNIVGDLLEVTDVIGQGMQANPPASLGLGARKYTTTMRPLSMTPFRY